MIALSLNLLRQVNIMRAKAYLQIIIAMLLWGSLGYFVRMADLPSSELVLLRIVLGGFFLLAVYLFSGRHSSSAALRRAAPLLLISGVAMGLNWLFLFEAYRYTTVSLATVAYYCSPVLVTLCSPLLLHERIAPLRLLGIFSALTGLVLIAGGLSGSGANLRGFGCGLLSACFYAGVTLMNKKVRGISGIESTLLQLLGAFLVMLPYTLIEQNGVLHLPQTPRAIIAVLILGIVHSGIALFLYFSSLQTLSAQSAALCSYIDPGSALLFSALLLHEHMTRLQIVAAVLILGGALVGELFSPTGKAQKRRS